MNLYVDYRERTVIDTINGEFAKPSYFGTADITVVSKMLEIGDYMITIDIEEGVEKVLCIIERKTLRDYADSLKDGRSTNLEKLLALRQETQCKIQYIVEGSHNPAMTEQFSGINYSSILANMTDISIVHDIHIIRTKDKQKTAEHLKFLCERYSHVYPTIQDHFKGSGEINTIVKKCQPSKDELKKEQLLFIWHNLTSKTDKINKPTSTARAAVLAQKWTLKDWLEGNIEEKDLVEVKVNGKKIWSHIEKLSKPLPKLGQIRLLACIKGITETSAKTLIEQKSLLDIINDTSSKDLVISETGGRTGKGNKLGKAKLNNICELCLMKV